MGKRAKIRREKIQAVKEERRKYLEHNYKEKYPWFFFWRRVDFWVFAACLISIIAYPFIPSKYLISTYYMENTTAKKNAKNTAVISTTMGNIVISFYEQDAPKTVQNFKKLAQNGFYDGLTWHRIIKEFMIQTGDPQGDGTGGPGYQFEDEINDHKIVAGTVAMANSGPNTNGSQFFIVTDSPQPHLDGKHTAFGYVTEGMDVVRAISEAPTDENDKPLSPILINNIKIND